MQRILFTILVALICNGVSVADNVLVLSLRNGMQQLYDIREPMELRTTADSFHISSKHIHASYSRNNVLGYSFSKYEAINVGIKTPTINNNRQITYHRDGKTLIIEGITARERIRIYSVNGMEHRPQTSRTASTATINFSSLPQGIYIISMASNEDNFSIKFINE